MQSSNKALKELICALKGLDPRNVKNVELTNPIDYSAYANKEIILDVKVLLNNNEILDVELQLYISPIWERRSLLYLCRTFDNIGVGEDYNKLKPTTLVAIMDNPLFPDYPEFYSHYLFLNTKNHQPYSTMLGINVLYLNQTNLATEEDKRNNLVHWAELFKATTWEDLKTLCTSHPEFEEVAKAMYNSNIQSQEKTLFEAHQKFVMDKVSLYSAGYEKAREEYQEQIDSLAAQNDSLTAQNDSLTAQISKLQKQLSDAGIPTD